MSAMSEATGRSAPLPEGGEYLPWTQRLLRAFPVPPVWMGLGLVLGHFVVFALYFALAGGPDISVGSLELWREFAGPTLVMALLIGYAPAAAAYSYRAQLELLRALRPVLGPADADPKLLAARVTRHDARLLRTVGWIAVAASLAVIGSEADVASRGHGRAGLGWSLYQNALAFWLSVRVVVHDLQVSARFSRLGQRVHVDLLNLRPLAPFARRGLHGALVCIVALSIFSLIFLLGHAAPVAPGFQALMLAVAAVALVLPVRGVHREIVRAKTRDLERLTAEIAKERHGLLEAGDASPRLVSLLALKTHLEAVREWPFDLPTVARFALYVAIGLGSWLGAAIVERVLDVLLG